LLENEPGGEIRRAPEAGDRQALALELFGGFDFFLRDETERRAVLEARDADDVRSGETAAEDHAARKLRDLGLAGDQRLNRRRAAFDEHHLHVEAMLREDALVLCDPYGAVDRRDRAVRGLEADHLRRRERRQDEA